MRFYLRHLIILTALCATGFAVIQAIAEESNFFVGFFVTVFSPCVCYAVAELLAPRNRSARVTLRLILLAIIACTIAFWPTSGAGSGHVFVVCTVLSLVWLPQLLVLRNCSHLRAQIVASEL